MILAFLPSSINGTHDSTMAIDDDSARVGWVLKNYDSIEIVEDNANL